MTYKRGSSWLWSHGSWIYNYLFHQCLSSHTLWVRIPLRRCVLNTTCCDKVCQWLAAGQWFSPVSSTNKTDLHDITEILLKLALNIINPIPTYEKKKLVCLKNINVKKRIVPKCYHFSKYVLCNSPKFYFTLSDLPIKRKIKDTMHSSGTAPKSSRKIIWKG